jgi:periplasmic copper chaperone A
MRIRTGLRVVLAVAIGALSTAVVGVGTASAHVTVNPKEATQGGYAKLAFRVPNEKDNASTTRLEIVIPTDRAPIASVSTRPVPGWTVAVEKTTLATPLKVHDSDVTEVVSKLTWTADDEGNQVKPGTFQEFEVSAGPLPEVDQIAFKALQTYSDGDVVRWIDEGAEADRPAPILKLTKAPAATGTPVDANADTEAAGDGDGSDEASGLGLTFGIAGLVAGVAALVVALLAYRRRSA